MATNAASNTAALQRADAKLAGHTEPIPEHRTDLDSHLVGADSRQAALATPHVGETYTHLEEQNGHHAGATTPLVAPGIHLDLPAHFQLL